MTDEQLDEYRLNGTRVRVIRDAEEANDVKGVVVAWDEENLLIRKASRNVVKLPRSYRIQPLSEPRQALV